MTEYNLRDLTPKEFDCLLNLCLRIYETSRGTYVIIGKRVEPKDVGLEDKVGADELLIEIPRGLLSGIGGEQNST